MNKVLSTLCNTYAKRLFQSNFKSDQLIDVISCKYSTHPLRFIEMQERWRKEDNLSKKWELIYKAPMDQALNWATTYLTLTTTSFTCAGLYYAIYANELRDYKQPILLGSSDIVLADNLQECLLYIGAFILFHVCIKVLISKYVLRLYKYEDRYVAIFRGHIYNSTKQYEFHLKDFKKLKPTFVVSWGDARFSLGDKHAIILENYFKTSAYFNYLLTKKNEITYDEDYHVLYFPTINSRHLTFVNSTNTQHNIDYLFLMPAQVVVSRLVNSVLTMHFQKMPTFGSFFVMASKPPLSDANISRLLLEEEDTSTLEELSSEIKDNVEEDDDELSDHEDNSLNISVPSISVSQTSPDPAEANSNILTLTQSNIRSRNPDDPFTPIREIWEMLITKC